MVGLNVMNHMRVIMDAITDNQQIAAGFDTTYIQLPEKFYQRQRPDHVPTPQLIRFNSKLAEEMGLRFEMMDKDQLARYFSGNRLFADAEPIAMAYAGHQFGSFVSQLGDGRAVLLGEIVDPHGKRYDIQLKGSGRTVFSRGGDGKSPLGPVIREYIVSEAMHCLGVPTTRALAMVGTGEDVWRQTGKLPGGILTRVSSGYVRIGTFEYFFARNDLEAIRQLADYAINRHFPEIHDTDNPYLSFFQEVGERQASLVARWMQLGFIHGVMNTDNTAICGETIDYGPCAFMDEYNQNKVFSSIDMHGRYRFVNQGSIILWNLSSLSNCLMHLFDTDKEKAKQSFLQVLEKTQQVFLQRWLQGIGYKLGLQTVEDDDIDLIKGYLDILSDQKADYTLAFRYLADNVGEDTVSDRYEQLFSHPEKPHRWIQAWRIRLTREKQSPEEIVSFMNRTNPAFIPLNHRVEKAIHMAERENSFEETHRLIDILANPYEEQPGAVEYMLPPKPEEQVQQTFCGT
jgi:protein adenylyltransferase